MDDHYSVRVSENGRPFSTRSIHDPFIHTRVCPRGLRVALQVLLGRYEVEVAVNADSETVEQVLELDPDYLGPIGSPRREAWNAQLNASLAAFAVGIEDDCDADDLALSSD
jgi:hypothetical protein